MVWFTVIFELFLISQWFQDLKSLKSLSAPIHVLLFISNLIPLHDTLLTNEPIQECFLSLRHIRSTASITLLLRYQKDKKNSRVIKRTEACRKHPLVMRAEWSEWAKFLNWNDDVMQWAVIKQTRYRWRTQCRQWNGKDRVNNLVDHHDSFLTRSSKLMLSSKGNWFVPTSNCTQQVIRMSYRNGNQRLISDSLLRARSCFY